MGFGKEDKKLEVVQCGSALPPSCRPSSSPEVEGRGGDIHTKPGIEDKDGIPFWDGGAVHHVTPPSSDPLRGVPEGRLEVDEEGTGGGVVVVASVGWWSS